jgi:ethanolamine ammonia-lyase small subunit
MSPQDEIAFAEDARIANPSLVKEEMSQAAAMRLRSLTPARVGLRRAGMSLATGEVLDFQLAHGQARDAVHAALQPAVLRTALLDLGQPAAPIFLHSAAADRKAYLQYPDRGRRLDEASRARLLELKGSELEDHDGFDLAIVLADGLSARAVERHAVPLLAKLLPALTGGVGGSASDDRVRLAPVCIVEQGRVAVGDEVGQILGASLVIVLIGERPGLSSPDSLGAYITWQPHPGRTDAERNCISNIRTEGLSYTQAAARLNFFIHEARRLQLTGVGLKDSDLSLGTGA